MARYRPVYVGVGYCSCKRIDVRLYQVPGHRYACRLQCDRCLKQSGFDVPKVRTADDIEVVDGNMRWKDEE